MNELQAAAKPAAPTPTREQRLGGIRRMINDGAVDLALQAIENWLRDSPSDPDLWVTKAMAHEKFGRTADAYTALAKAAELRPKNIELKAGLARLAHLLGHEGDEIRMLSAAARLGTIPDRLMMRLIALHTKRQEWTEAIALTDKLLAKDPNDQTYVVKHASVLAEAGRLDDARAVLDRVLDKEAPSEQAVANWAAIVGERMGRLEEVVARMQSLAVRPGATWMVYACLGRALGKLDRIQPAIDTFRKATEIAPEIPSNWFDMAVLQRQIGQVNESQASFERTLELEPTNAGALRVLGYEHKYAYGDAEFKRVNLALAKIHSLEKKYQVEVHYAAAKAFEDVGELGAAFAHYARAGQLQKEMSPWAETRMRGVLNMMKNFLKPEDYAEARRQGFPTDKPVFVFGMPRSGTTLLEQVIASHPQAFGAGELKLAAGVLNGIKIGRATLETTHEGTARGLLIDGVGLSINERGRKYVEIIEQLAGSTPPRVVDKMPGNYNWVGLLDVILPGCHLIHSRRHPVETCLSQYRLFFPDGINFSYDLRDLGKAYRLYHDYMAYWSKLLGDKILHLRYEDMVLDLDTQARRIIEFIGLPWDDACLRFYENERKVLTASVTQVRRPIYTTSINRWRKYEEYLKPLLDELGPLVKEYEDELESVHGPAGKS